MPDGKRRRRHSANRTKRCWYAHYRAFRFAKRFGGTAECGRTAPPAITALNFVARISANPAS